jgi:large subunit ribosomal protein L15
VKLHHLKPAAGAKRDRKRVGRGRAGVRGKTAGRGTKGYLAKHNPRLGFEGGQMPLQRRLPKFGFNNPSRREFEEVKVGDLEGLAGVVDPAALKQAGLVRGNRDGVVVLGGGELRSAVTVKVHRVTAGARASIEKAGGKVELIPARLTMHEKARAERKAAAAK